MKTKNTSYVICNSCGEMIDVEKQQVIDEHLALVEMYKAGFLDGYRIKNRLRKKEDWSFMNKLYKRAFLKRFEKKINKVFKVLKK